MRHEKPAGGGLKSIRWPLFIAANGALLLMVGVSAGRETYQQWKVDQEIVGLKEQIETLEGKKVRLLDTIQKLHSLDELDKEARAQLDVKKPGERVIVLKGLENESPTARTTFISTTRQQEMSNPKKWLYYFLKQD
ncbi:hypothetical protein FJZ48_01925 [Candidatus Uhrbacteria bacterium]|nr:hypothetical protein [Candidatus Uhrbacteria bacterium]